MIGYKLINVYPETEVEPPKGNLDLLDEVEINLEQALRDIKEYKKKNAKFADRGLINCARYAASTLSEITSELMDCKTAEEVKQ